MADHKIDLFHDDIREVFRKYGIDDPADKAANLKLADAFDELMDEVEAAFEAADKAHKCDHCGNPVMRLHAVREPKGGLLSMCKTCIATGGRVVAAGG